MKQPSRAVGALLDDLGLAIGDAQVELVDFTQAEEGYVHHTRVPVAVVGYMLASPSLATRLFPKFSFINLIQKRPSMDEDEACAVAAICGVEVTPPFWGNPIPFGRCLWDVIERYDLGPFFERVPDGLRYGSEGDHFLMRPKGFDWRTEAEIPGALKQWRDDYRRSPLVRQLMVATVLQLYKSGEDRFWMVRVPKKWHAEAGLEVLRANGALKDWARLYALYPGW